MIRKSKQIEYVQELLDRRFNTRLIKSATGSKKDKLKRMRNMFNKVLAQYEKG